MANFAKNPDNVNGKFLLSEDIQRLEDHRQNFMDFLYVQIEEHSQKLQIYADLFEKTQSLVNVEKDFLTCMNECGAFP